MMEAVKVTRKLDGKGRLILPGDFRDAAGFAPDERWRWRLQLLTVNRPLLLQGRRQKQNEIKRSIREAA